MAGAEGRWPEGRAPRVAFSADLGGMVRVDPEVAGACREAARWLAAHAAAAAAPGGGEAGGAAAAAAAGAGALEEACPDFGSGSDALRTFRALRTLAWAEMAQLLSRTPGARDVIKPDNVWQVGGVRGWRAGE